MNTDVRGPKGELKVYRYLTLFIELGTCCNTIQS